MRKLIITILLASGCISSFAQPYRNEWINFSSQFPYSMQQYFKMQVYKRGIYRIDTAALLLSNIPYSTVNPANFQVFFQGSEQRIYVQNNGNPSKLDGDDFIEFYADKNNGKLDADLYKRDSAGYYVNDPSLLPNPYSSLFSDTAIYYLTWGNSPGLRLTLETDSNYTGTPSAYFTCEVLHQYLENYFPGKPSSVGSYDPDYTEGEGWFSWDIFKGGAKGDGYLDSRNAYASGPDASFSTVVVGASSDGFNPDHHLVIDVLPNNATPASFTYNAYYDGYVAKKIDFTLPVSKLGSWNTGITWSAQGSGNVDRNGIAYALLKYPHTYDLEGDSTFRMLIPNSTQVKTYLVITDFTAGGQVPVLYDLTNGKRIKTFLSGNTIRALVPNPSSSGDKECYISGENAINRVSFLKPVNDDPAFYGKFINYEYLGLTTQPDYLIVTPRMFWAEANAYKAHRSSTAGGGHSVVVADINELYDQFSWGTPKHPLSIKNFANFCLDKWASPPKHMLLLGKSLNSNYIRNDASYFEMDVVPTYGYPASDQLLTSGLNGTLYEPAIATGRVSAKTPSEAGWYLQKVIEYESNKPAEWMKRCINFCGGETGGQNNLLCSYLHEFEDTLEGQFFGAEVITFSKSSTAPIQLNLSDSLKKLIEGGVSIMQFFGHSSATGFDQSIDAPEAYNNYGKYPLIVSYGCFSGDIHTLINSLSEQFVLLQNKGSIGFIAGTTLGLVNELHSFGTYLNSNISRVSYGQSIGTCMKNTIKSYESMSPTELYHKITSLTMTLHGDPGVIINSFPKPDLTITQPDIFCTTVDGSSGEITTIMDSMMLHITCTNIGKVAVDSFDVSIVRTYPDGDQASYKRRMPPAAFKSYLTIVLPVDKSLGAGLNTFDVTVDSGQEIDEIDEGNNKATIQVLIKSDDVYPVYPYRYAIVPNNTVTLKASTSDPFAPEKSYTFQIDTTDQFNVLAAQTISQKGGVLSWVPPLVLQDSTVYYWRISVSGSNEWKESSFIYIPGKTGWSQAHFPQFTKGDKYKYVNANKNTRKFEFVDDIKAIKANTFKDSYWSPQPGHEEDWVSKMTLASNDDILGAGACTNNLNIGVIDSSTGEAWSSYKDAGGPGLGQFGDIHCSSNQEVTVFCFNTETQADRDTIRSFLNQIPCGFKVIVYSVDKHYADSFDLQLIGAFNTIGSKMSQSYIADSLHSDTPFIIIGEKCAPQGSALEIVADSLSQFIEIKSSMTVHWKYGAIYSETIGPASKWGSLHWRATSDNNDTITLNMVGIRNDGTEKIFMANIPRAPGYMDIYSLDTLIDAATYPYMRLEAYVRDATLRTPPQLGKWQIYFDGVPEVAINPNIYSYFVNNVEHGDSIRFETAIENISDYPMDSMNVDFWIDDENRDRHYYPMKGKLAPLPAGGYTIARFEFKTDSFPGNNNLWIDANPFDLKKAPYKANYALSHRHLLEQYHFNNIAIRSFNVGRDLINPLLDVTFDGYHILDGDIVSAKPEIVIQLTDENKFLALDDTSEFAIYIKKDKAFEQDKLYFEKVQDIKSDRTRMKWSKASLPQNRFHIEYSPVLEDGVYELYVQAKDKSNNLSGASEYKVSFEVINKPTITEVLNYPNPFSTSTKFAFVLTGSEVPTDFKIQILTPTGRIVKEIGRSEIGNLRIGRNVTDYAWDGKDEFGDQLANGIYFYRVLSRLNGETLDKRNSDADAFFKNGWGKMYLMR